jgi:hypothetical protein
VQILLISYILSKTAMWSFLGPKFMCPWIAPISC